jgi:hypothetical protein
MGFYDRALTRPKKKRANHTEDHSGADREAIECNRPLRRQGWEVIRIRQLPPAVYAALRYQLVVNPRKEVEGLWLRAAAERRQPEANEGLKIKSLPISAPSPEG